MSEVEELRWFKETFGPDVVKALTNTPFTVDMLAAIALQETGEIWPLLRKKLSKEKILALCVGDTLDAPKRSAFPKNKAALLAVPNGNQMWHVARAALLEVAEVIPSYRGAAKNPEKFCHGFGIWQYDIQFFKTDPEYFLQARWAVLEDALGKAVGELKAAQKRVGLNGKSVLSNEDMAKVAIAYNRGSYNPARGLKQGYKDSAGVYYGEYFAKFLKMAQGVSDVAERPVA